MLDLKDKVVLITGSSIGIGREDAFKFAKEKAKVIITYFQDKKEAEKVKEKCEELGASDVLVVPLNVLDNKSIKECIKEVIKKFGEVNILINNAGVYTPKDLEETSFEDIENQIRTNFEGLVKVTREVLPYIKDMIINLGSGAGFDAFGGLATYAATKWAIRGFTKSLAEEVRLKVYCVNPGMVATRMTNFSGTSPEKVAQVILNLAKGEYNLKSGSDVNIWDYV